MSLQTIWPLIWVTDMERSLAFYRNGLGFQMVASWEGPYGIAWCRLTRGPVSLMLQVAEGEVPPPVEGQAAELFILCDDAHTLHTPNSAPAASPPLSPNAWSTTCSNSASPTPTATPSGSKTLCDHRPLPTFP